MLCSRDTAAQTSDYGFFCTQMLVFSAASCHSGWLIHSNDYCVTGHVIRNLEGGDEERESEELGILWEVPYKTARVHMRLSLCCDH